MSKRTNWPNWPHWFGGTFRQWQTKKRAEVRAAEKALRVLLMGSVYLPKVKSSGQDHWVGGMQLFTDVRDLRKAMSKENWK